MGLGPGTHVDPAYLAAGVPSGGRNARNYRGLPQVSEFAENWRLYLLEKYGTDIPSRITVDINELTCNGDDTGRFQGLRSTQP
jgi:hypothetical protein